MIILDMINKASVRLAISAFHLENNIIILDIDPGDYSIENKTITAVFNPSGIETDPLVVVDNVIKLPILSHRINNGNNSIQLNFRWDTDKKEQSGLILWRLNKSLIPAATDQEDIDIISYLISEVNRIISDTGDIKEALDESVANANTIQDILANEVTGTIKVATDTGIDLEDTIEDANTVKGTLEETIQSAGTSKTNLEGTIGAAGTAQTNLNNKIGEATTSKQVLDQAIVDNQIVTLPVFTQHKLDYAEQISNVSRLITRYVHSGNIEAHCSAVNIDTDTFTSISHGFKNGEQIIPVLNPNAGAVYPMNVFVGGMSTTRYYVINATTDTFQISTINNGSAVDLVTNATQDLTKWHFEKFVTAVNITNLPPHKKYKFLIKGRQPNPVGYANNLSVNGIRIGGDSGKAIKETGTTFGDGDNVFNANMFLNLETIVDWTDILTLKITGYSVNSTALNSFSTSYINRLRAVPTRTNTDIISFATGNWLVINGLVVEVYTI